MVVEEVHLDGREARLGQELARPLLAPHGAEPIAALGERDRHAVHARDHVEERPAGVVEVLVVVARPLDVLHEVDAVRLQRPADPLQQSERPRLVVDGVERGDEGEGLRLGVDVEAAQVTLL